ncbi:MAG: hypothetical protein ABIK31_01170, partial [candidate division WOR-3 bacterium]
AIIALLYLAQHRVSVRMTQEIVELQKTKQLISEELMALKTECAKTFLFSNLQESAQKLNLISTKNCPLPQTAQNQDILVANPTHH